MKGKIVLIISLLLTVSALGQDTINFSFDLDKEGFSALKNFSKTEGKNVFIYFTATWCAPCLKLEKEVFPEEEVVKLFNENFICVKTLPSKTNEEHARLRDHYNIVGYPGFIIINSKGEIIHKMPRAISGSGYKTRDEIIQFGQEAIENKVSYAAYKEKYDQGDRSYETIKGYLNLSTPVAMNVLDGFYDNQAQQVLDGYFATQSKESLSNRDNWYIINNYVDNASTEPFQYLLKNPEEFYEKYGKGVVDMKIFQVLDWFGFAGDGNRTKKTKLEMKSWDYPIVNDFMRLNEASNKYNNELNILAREVDDIYLKYYQGLSGNINRTAWNIYQSSNEENSTIEKETVSTANNWMTLVMQEFSDNESYKDTYDKIQERMQKF